MKGKLFCFLLLYGHLLLPGQDLPHSAQYYKSLQAVYQQWLDVVGLGEGLKVYTIEVKDKEVSLFLYIPSPYTARDSSLDYISQTWKNIKAEFDDKNPIDLEKQLFLKWLHVTDLEPKQITVQLYDTYDLSLTYLFFVGIHYGDKSIKVEQSGFRASTHKVKVFQPVVEENAHGQAQVRKSAREGHLRIIEKVEAFIDREFGAPDVEIFPLILEDSIFQFTVLPLEKQVLADQQERLICVWLRRLSFDCSTLKKEKLTFTFTIMPRDYGYDLNCILNGKFAEPGGNSGKLGTYKDIDVDPDSKEILKSYGERLMGSLQSYLMQ